MTARSRRSNGDVIALRPADGPAASERHPSRHTPATASPMLAALDVLERTAENAGVLYVDVVLQLALARYLVGVVGTIALGAEPTVAQVHALRELRLATSELRQLVVGYARQR